jgi:hypothetical protein
LDVEEALFSYLSTYAGLAALVGTRIYPILLPQNPTLPAVTYQMISGIDDHCISEDPDNTEARFQFTAWGTSAASARAVAKQIKKAFKNFTGLMGGADGVQIGHALQTGRYDRTDKMPDGTVIYSRIEDYMIMYDDPTT